MTAPELTMTLVSTTVRAPPRPSKTVAADRAKPFLWQYDRPWREVTTRMNLWKEIGQTVRDAMRSWPRTYRLCALITVAAVNLGLAQWLVNHQ